MLILALSEPVFPKASPSLQSIDALTAEEAQKLRGVLFDLDDTLLDGTCLTEAAYSALWSLHRGGLRLVAVTGRPAGWGEVMARQWPIDGIVTENGAVALYREGGQARRLEDVDEPTRRARRIRLASAYATLRERFPEVRLASDTEARLSDIALDVGESQAMPSDVREALIDAARELGLRTYLSSVHLHLTLDSHDKASGTIAFLRARFGEDETAARSRYAFIGDSGNDAACFSAFSTSFGVANLRASTRTLSVLPRYIASGERGAGFAEIAARLLRLRGLGEPSIGC